MRALSIKQPWASCIVDPCCDSQYAQKRIENRTWKPPQHTIGNRIAIHASGGFDINAEPWIRSRGLPYPIQRMTKGAIIDVATVVGCIARSDNPWFMGPYGWVLDDVQRLETPVPCRGSLSLWRIPDDVQRKIEDQLQGLTVIVESSQTDQINLF